MFPWQWTSEEHVSVSPQSTGIHRQRESRNSDSTGRHLENKMTEHVNIYNPTDSSI